MIQKYSYSIQIGELSLKKSKPNTTYEMVLDLRKIVFFKRKKYFIRKEIKTFLVVKAVCFLNFIN